MSKIYWDRFAEEYTKDKDFAAPPERYTRICDSTMEGIYKITYKLRHDDKVISFAYTEEELKYASFDMLLEGFLAMHGLSISQIQEYPCIWCIPSSKYKKIEEELE